MKTKEARALVKKDCILRGDDWRNLTRKQRKIMVRNRKRRKIPEPKPLSLNKLATMFYFLDAMVNLDRDLGAKRG
jgi:hypothetical protein